MQRSDGGGVFDVVDRMNGPTLCGCSTLTACQVCLLYLSTTCSSSTFLLGGGGGCVLFCFFFFPPFFFAEYIFLSWLLTILANPMGLNPRLHPQQLELVFETLFDLNSTSWLQNIGLTLLWLKLSVQCHQMSLIFLNICQFWAEFIKNIRKFWILLEIFLMDVLLNFAPTQGVWVMGKRKEIFILI